jgi:hypothetical protein
MKKTLPIVLVIAMTLVMMSFTPAQARWGEGGRGKGMPTMDKAQMRERIELLKMWKLIEVLDLDQETAMKLFPVMHEYNLKQQEIGKVRGATIKQIREEVEKGTTDSAALGSLIAQFKQNERDMTEMRIKQLDALSKVLSDEQIAKMIIFVPKMEQRIRGLMSEAKTRQKERKRWMQHREDRRGDFDRGPRFEPYE